MKTDCITRTIASIGRDLLAGELCKTWLIVARVVNLQTQYYPVISVALINTRNGLKIDTFWAIVYVRISCVILNNVAINNSLSCEIRDSRVRRALIIQGIRMRDYSWFSCSKYRHFVRRSCARYSLRINICFRSCLIQIRLFLWELHFSDSILTMHRDATHRNFQICFHFMNNIFLEEKFANLGESAR